jgi:phenylacetate 2-hydroxylase
MVSFTREVLRYWTTLNLSFSRQSNKPIEWNGALLPAEIPVFLNAWAANHDPDHFQHPHQFIPERFMGLEEKGTQHFSYGAGTRNCLGNHLANRELYAMFIRLILAFHIKPTTVPKMYPELDTVKCNAVPTSMVTQPKPFQVRIFSMWSMIRRG